MGSRRRWTNFGADCPRTISASLRVRYAKNAPRVNSGMGRPQLCRDAEGGGGQREERGEEEEAPVSGLALLPQRDRGPAVGRGAALGAQVLAAGGDADQVVAAGCALGPEVAGAVRAR